jgi:DNA (cytosine-5)-methyltransferase 1
MFTGVGGFELGLEGHECVGFSEIDKHCSLLLADKFGGLIWKDVKSAIEKENFTIKTNQLVRFVLEKEKENGEKLIVKKVEIMPDNIGIKEKKELLNTMVENVSVVENQQKNFLQLTTKIMMEQKKDETTIITPAISSITSLKTISQTNTNCYVITVIWRKQYMELVHIKRGENYEPTHFGDATKINPDELPDFDMLCGGFPCQAFSIAGRREGFNDTRGTLFFEISRIIKTKRPKIVFLENVKGLLNHDQGKTFRVIIQTLSELGYDVQWMVCNSKFFGVPQNRERVFIIGNIRGEPRPEILPFRESNGIYKEKEYERCAKAMTSTMFKGIGNDGTTLIDERDRELTRVYDVEGNAPTLKGHTGGWQEPKIALMIQSHSPRTNDPKKGGSGPLISDEHCFTIDRTPHNVIMGMKIRRLTPTECERLQGFPDNFTKGFSDTTRYKMMGNAVTVNVIKAINKKLEATTK